MLRYGHNQIEPCPKYYFSCLPVRQFCELAALPVNGRSL